MALTSHRADLQPKISWLNQASTVSGTVRISRFFIQTQPQVFRKTTTFTRGGWHEIFAG